MNKPTMQIDPVLFRVVQPHITSNPQLWGVTDPVPVRSGFHNGEKDSVPFVMGPYPMQRGAPHKKVNKGSFEPPTEPEEWKKRQVGIIGRFNMRFPVGDVLKWYGFEPDGDRYLHPDSMSMIPDTVINSGTHCYCFSPNNPMYEQGVDRETGEIMNRNHDAFDVLRILGCDGDEKLAIAAARKKLEAEND